MRTGANSVELWIAHFHALERFLRFHSVFVPRSPQGKTDNRCTQRLFNYQTLQFPQIAAASLPTIPTPDDQHAEQMLCSTQECQLRRSRLLLDSVLADHVDLRQENQVDTQLQHARNVARTYLLPCGLPLP